MRQNDTVMIYTPVNIRTDSLYMPTNVPIEQMTHQDLRKGLCYRCGGNLQVCISDCPAPCAFGRELMRRCEQNERNA